MTGLASQSTILTEKSKVPVEGWSFNDIIKQGADEDACDMSKVKEGVAETISKGQCTMQQVFPKDGMAPCYDSICMAALYEAYEDGGCDDLPGQLKTLCQLQEMCDLKKARADANETVYKGQCTLEQIFPKNGMPPCHDSICIDAYCKAYEDAGCGVMSDAIHGTCAYQKKELPIAQLNVAGGQPVWQSYALIMTALVFFGSIFYGITIIVKRNSSYSISPPQELLG